MIFPIRSRSWRTGSSIPTGHNEETCAWRRQAPARRREVGPRRESGRTSRMAQISIARFVVSGFATNARNWALPIAFSQEMHGK